MRRSAMLVGSVAGCLIVGLPGTAAAAPSEHERFEFSDTEVIEDFCGTGVNVLHTIAVRGTDFFAPKNADFASVAQGKETFTFDGTTVTGHFAGRVVDTIVEGVEEGPHVHVVIVSGIPEKFKLEGRKAGRGADPLAHGLRCRRQRRQPRDPVPGRAASRGGERLRAVLPAHA